MRPPILVFLLVAVVQVQSDRNDSCNASNSNNTAVCRANNTYGARVSRARLQVELQAELLEASSTFLSTVVSDTERAEVRKSHLVANLERHGVTLDDFFGWYVTGLAEENGYYDDDHPAEAAEPPSLLEGAEVHQNKEAFSLAPLQTSLEPPSLLGGAEADDERAGSRDVLSSMQQRHASASRSEDQAEEVELQDTKESHESNEDGDTIKWEAIKSQVKELKKATQRRGSRNEKPAKYLSQSDPAAYQTWKKEQIYAYHSSITEIFKRAANFIAPANQIQKAKVLLDKAIELNSAAEEIFGLLEKASKVDWSKVTEREDAEKLYSSKKSGLFGKGIKKVWSTGKALVDKAKAHVGRAYKSLKDRLKKKNVCSTQASNKEKEYMGKAPGNNGETLLDELEKTDANPDALLEGALENSDNMLKKVVVDGKEADGKLKELGGEMTTTSLPTTSLRPADRTPVETKVDDAEKHSCDVQAGKTGFSLRTMLKQMKKALFSALPNAGIRGIGGAASIAATGFEEVIDFENLEIGYFTWHSAQVGGSALSVGASGYMGLGWKGYKKKWNLEEATQTAMYASLGIGLPILNFGGPGVAIATDADDSLGFPWLPDSKGFNEVVVSVGSSVGLSLGTNLDLGASRYNMLTSECFTEKWKFLKAIINPICKTCAAGLEKNFIGTSRLASRLVDPFPILSELIFMWMGHTYYEKNYRSQTKTHEAVCSERSTKHRDNPQILINKVLGSILASAQVLSDIDEASKNLDEIIAKHTADDKLKPEQTADDKLKLMAGSEEMEELSEEFSEHMCLRGPTLKKFKTYFENESQKIMSMDLVELKQKCKRRASSKIGELKRRASNKCTFSSFDHFQGSSKVKRKAAFKKHLQELEKKRVLGASKEHPYGLCKPRLQTFGVAGSMLGARSMMLAAKGSCKNRGAKHALCTPFAEDHYCRCKPGYCYKEDQDISSGCVKFLESADDLKGLYKKIGDWSNGFKTDLVELSEKLNALGPPANSSTP